MPQKNSKKVKKKEELPSFLRNLTSRNLDRTLKITKKNLYSNPIFFGECKQFHSTPHPVFLGGLSYPQYSKTSDENICPDLFLPEHEITEKARVAEPAKNRYRKKCMKEFIDEYPHRCPGVRKVFVPENEVFTPDLGESTSEIESDTWREIPFGRVKSTLTEWPEPEAENVMLSDMNRALLPYEQRMAHNHFPKEFITVKLVGPIIPASITITKIPSKRKRMSDFAFEVEENVDNIKSVAKTTAKTNEEIEKGKEEEAEEMEIEEIKVEGMEIEEEEQEEQEEQEQEEDEEEGEEKEKKEPGEEEVEEAEESSEGKTEETKGPDEEKEAGEAIENGAPVAPSGTILEEEEEEVKTTDEGGEIIEDDKEE